MSTYVRHGSALLQGLGDVTISPFRDSAEAWRSLVTQLAGDLPTDFMIAWIDVESGGNPCDYTSLRESGISQLMYPDNLNTAHTTEAAQHPVPPCVAGTSSSASYSSLSPSQQNDQVQGMVTYVNAMRANAHAQLQAVGTDWDESTGDFWKLVKMNHVAPATIPPALQAALAANGTPPPDWATFAQFASANGVPTAWLSNASKVGAWGSSSGVSLADYSDILIDQITSPFSSALGRVMLGVLALGGVALGVWWYRRRSHRRVAHAV